MKFKKGDKVVYIDADDWLDQPSSMKLYGIYIIEEFVDRTTVVNYKNDNAFLKEDLILLEDVSGAFVSSRFITIGEYRKQKMKKILNR